ncbi:MAG: hypothetical protein C4540_02930 [Candidatus Omnitrophota bacterium]|jgi:DNA-binding protein YbaB|nr:MAG: hypothetical protein C4540_02930 [Candidatus Omnitrophota bacterium]
MTAAQEVKEVVILKSVQETGKENLEKDIKEAYNRAVVHSRQLAAQEMQDIVGFNMPGIS